jgi:hypothetical protein
MFFKSFEEQGLSQETLAIKEMGTLLYSPPRPKHAAHQGKPRQDSVLQLRAK